MGESRDGSYLGNPVLKVLHNGSTQMLLESYFLRYEDGYTFAKVKSMRLKSVLHDIQSGDTTDTVETDNTEMVTLNTKGGATPKNRKHKMKK